MFFLLESGAIRMLDQLRDGVCQKKNTSAFVLAAVDAIGPGSSMQ